MSTNLLFLLEFFIKLVLLGYLLLKKRVELVIEKSICGSHLYIFSLTFSNKEELNKYNPAMDFFI